MKVKISNAYSNGHESERVVEFDQEPEVSDLEDWWDGVVFDETGDGTGIDSNLGSYYEAEIIEASNPALVGMTASWG